jgi:hypothetical protein
MSFADTESRRTGERQVRVLYLDLDGTVRKGSDELGRFVNGPEDVECAALASLDFLDAEAWRSKDHA